MYQTHNSQPELFDFKANTLNFDWVNWYMRTMNCDNHTAVKAGVAKLLSQVSSMTDFANSWILGANLDPLGFVSQPRHGGMRGGFMTGMYMGPSHFYGSSRPVTAFTDGAFQVFDNYNFPNLHYTVKPGEPSPFHKLDSSSNLKDNVWVKWFMNHSALQQHQVSEEYAIKRCEELIGQILDWKSSISQPMRGVNGGLYVDSPMGTQDGNLSLSWVLQQALVSEEQTSIAGIQEAGEKLLSEWMVTVAPRVYATQFPMESRSVYTEQYTQQGRYPADINEPSLFYKDDSENPQVTNDPWIRWRAQELGYRPNGNFNKGLMDEVKTKVLTRVESQSRIVVPHAENSWANNVQPQLCTPNGYLSLIWVIWMADQNLNMSWEDIHEEGINQIKASNLNESVVYSGQGNPGRVG